ncbi:MAG: hypothetical protein GY853_13400 [PVC group bacterium]|nr:hypothetical protein [PVC group bacterium]
MKTYTTEEATILRNKGVVFLTPDGKKAPATLKPRIEPTKEDKQARAIADILDYLKKATDRTENNVEQIKTGLLLKVLDKLKLAGGQPITVNVPPIKIPIIEKPKKKWAIFDIERTNDKLIKSLKIEEL